MANKRATLSAEVTRLETMGAEVAERLAQARDALGALDKTIHIFDHRINPELIKPVHKTKGRYGKHGALRESIERALKSVSPAAIATDELSLILALQFGFDFGLGASTERAKWVKNSLSPTLRAMVRDGVLVKAHDDTEYTSEVGRWMLKVDVAPTLAQLREQAGAAGGMVTAADLEVDMSTGEVLPAGGPEHEKGKRRVRFRF
jgi:hypothetical protein